MVGEGLILRFNEFNGQRVSTEALKDFHAKIQNYLDSIGSGPYVPALREIQSRVTKTIKELSDKKIEEFNAEILPLKIKEEKTIEKPKEKSLGKVGQKMSKKERRKIFKPKSRGKKVQSKKVKAKSKKIEKVSAKEIKTYFKKKIFKRKARVKKKRVEEKAVPENKSPLQAAKPPSRLAPNHPKEGNAEAPKTKPALSGLVDASALAGIDFKEFGLTDQYATDFHKLNSDTQVMIWGKPGSGKTVYLLKFAQYLAEKLSLKVLYVANEEFGRSTFSQKIKEFNIGTPNLKFTKNATDEMIDQFDAIFFDSVNSLGMTLDDYRQLRDKHPNKLFIDVVQSTKDGDFRGGKDWEHEVDIAGEIVNRKLILRKNRLDPDNSKKANALMKDELISEGKKKAEIKQAVKESLETPQPQAA